MSRLGSEHFMRLCGARDKKILKDMTQARFSDLVRLLHISGALDFVEMNYEIFKVLYDRDPLRLKAFLEAEVDLDDVLACPEAWERDFYEQAPTPQAKRELHRRMGMTWWSK